MTYSPFLTQTELAQRWRISERTLEGWRYNRRKVKFVKILGRVLYRLEDVERLELESEVPPSRW